MNTSSLRSVIRFAILPAVPLSAAGDFDHRGWWSALEGKDCCERERFFAEGSILNFHDGLSDEGAFVIVMSDGTGVQHAGGVAFFPATEA